MLPNFLIIGAPKAGTTALWHFLRQHPDVYMSPHKEPRYFALCNEEIDFRGPGDRSRFNFVTSFDEYQALFNGVNGERAIGEASTWYQYVKSAAPAIKERIPDVKLIAILRDPVNRAFSNYLHVRNEGLDPAPTFREAMEREEERISQHWSPRFHYVQKGFYYQQIQHLLRHFDREQLRIYLYDDFSADADTVLSDIYSYLGIAQYRKVETRERVNDSRRARSPALEQVLGSSNPLKRMARRMVPKAWRKTVKIKLRALNRKPKPTLSPEDRKHFIKVYEDDILHLQSFLGRDLSTWLRA